MAENRIDNDNAARGGPHSRLTLRSALWASSSSFISIGIFSFFINLLMLTGPLFMLQIYDRVLTSRSLPTLVVLFALVASLFAVLGILELIRSRVLTRIGAHVDQHISQRVFDSAMQISLRTGGDSSATMPLHDLNVVQQFLSGPGLPALFDAPWVPVYIFVIFLFHWNLGLLAVVAAILLFIVALLNDIRSRRPMTDTATAMAEANRIADAGRRNAEVLTAMAMLGAIRNRWEENHLDALMHETRARDRAGSLTALSKSLRLFLQSAMLAIGAALVIYGEISPGVMIAASIILGRALQPVEQAITHWRGLGQYRQAVKNLKELLEKVPPPEDKMLLPAPEGRLDIQGLHVAAPGSQRIILRNISFSLEPGKILGIFGASAAGKSTLARALVGVWPPAGGEVRLDGATLDQWHPDQLGRHIGYLPQDVELFAGTIKENISRFVPNPDADGIINVARQAGVHEMIKQLGGYDADIGPMGGNLSAGQRQRVGLARALYGEPALVVLDEPNSNLDGAGEKALFTAIIEMRDRGQTVIIIAHRLNILGLTDYLLELNGGMQRQFGPREDVISNIRKRKAPGDGNGGLIDRNENSAKSFQITPLAGMQRTANGKPLD